LQLLLFSKIFVYQQQLLVRLRARLSKTAKIILPKVLVPSLTKKMTALTVKTIVKTNSNNRYENKTA
jgi:hypothetical protein